MTSQVLAGCSFLAKALSAIAFRERTLRVPPPKRGTLWKAIARAAAGGDAVPDKGRIGTRELASVGSATPSLRGGEPKRERQFGP